MTLDKAIQLRACTFAACWLTLLAIFSSPVTAAGEPRVIPSRFDAGRVYVRLRTADGRGLELYTDSGGGSLILSTAAAKRLGLPLTALNDPDAKAELGPFAMAAPAPTLATRYPSLPDTAYVMPEVRELLAFPAQGDGIIGARWFGKGIWTWDYPRHRLVNERSDWRPPASARIIPATIKTDEKGERISNFVRVMIEVDGRDLPVLLDTGAETYLTPTALGILNDHEPAFRATSMISGTIFDGWHHTHPDWQLVDEAQVGTGAAMIRVPSVALAGLRVGPVWFTRRSDAAFSKGMAPLMDASIVGSIGGNLLGHFRMTMDFGQQRLAVSPGDTRSQSNLMQSPGASR